MNGRVVDGTGGPWFRADVCIAGDRIAAVGKLEGATARRRIDASRLVVAPGFIDMMGQSEYNLLVDNRAASKITQGITTEVTGEGSSIGPLNARMIEAGRASYEHFGYTPTFTTLAGYFAELERRGSAVNLATFVGAGGVRDFLIGQEDRPPTPQELEAMKAAVARTMEEGALGLSSSLIYIPDHFASTEELIELAKVAARYGGSYITHMRDEGDDNSIGIDAAMGVLMEVCANYILGGDSITATGDALVKVGRYPTALTAREQGIPFYVAADTTKLDPIILTGRPFPVREMPASDIWEGPTLPRYAGLQRGSAFVKGLGPIKWRGGLRRNSAQDTPSRHSGTAGSFITLWGS